MHDIERLTVKPGINRMAEEAGRTSADGMSNALSASSENVDYGKVSVPWQLIWESTGARDEGAVHS